MTPQEMHIGVNLYLQKINSKAVDSFEPEEIDWQLSVEQLKFIRQRTNPKSNLKRDGFEYNQKRYDDIRSLIVSSSIPMFIRNGVSMFGNLPADYFQLVNDRSLVDNLCKTSFQTYPTTQKTYYYCVIPMDQTYSFYADGILYKSSPVIDVVSDYPTVANQLVDQSTIFMLINVILELQIPNTQIYWQTWNNMYFSNSIIFVSEMSFPNMDWVSNSTTVTYTTSTIIFDTYQVSQDQREFPNRLTNTEVLFNILESSFATTEYRSPVSSLENRQIHVYHNQKFIVTQVNIDYIRKPPKISLSLNHPCILDDNCCDEIIMNTAKFLAGITSSSTYKEIINENLLQE